MTATPPIDPADHDLQCFCRCPACLDPDMLLLAVETSGRLRRKAEQQTAIVEAEVRELRAALVRRTSDVNRLQATLRAEQAKRARLEEAVRG